jgi:hypothetical protein
MARNAKSLGFAKATLVNFILFCRGRLRISAIVKYLPEQPAELASILKFSGKYSIPEWAAEMSMYNQTCMAPDKIGLTLRSKRNQLRYYSGDRFLIQIHPEKLAEVLDSWEIFAGRVAPLILINIDARSWRLNRKLIIYRRHWFLLSKRVRNVVMTISQLSQADFRNQLHSRSHGHEMLRVSACRAACLYGGFGKRCWSSPI